MTFEYYRSKFTERGPDECWPWQEKSRDKDGYGIMSWREDGQHYTRRAHRWGWEHRFGPIPPREVVRHSCDNPPCQNPAHWLLGTAADNNQDARDRGRARANPGGERHHRATLSDAQVNEIRQRYTGAWGEISALGREYGVGHRCIGRLLDGTRRTKDS